VIEDMCCMLYSPGTHRVQYHQRRVSHLLFLRKKGRCETRILWSISDILRESQRNKKCETRFRTPCRDDCCEGM